MSNTRYRDDSKAVVALGLQPGEDYGAAEVCHTHITQHEHAGKAFEVYFDQMSGPMSQWKAFCLGIGTKSGLERDKVIQEMQAAITATMPIPAGNLTGAELGDWRSNYADTLIPQQRMEVDGVSFYKTGTGSIGFSYKNSRGLIFPDNGYRGEQPDGRNYYALLKLSVSHSQESRFNPSFQPNLAAAAAAVKHSWEAFTK